MAAIFDRFTGSAKAVFISAESSAQTLGHAEITPQHLLMGLLSRNPSDAGALLDELNLDRQTAWSRLRDLLPHADAVVEGHVPLSEETKAVIARAITATRPLGRREVNTAVLLLAILQEPGLPATKLLAELGVSADGVAGALGERQSQEQLVGKASAKRGLFRVGKSS